MKKIFFEPSYQSNWNQVATLLKYGGEKKISKIFEYFVRRKEDRQCSRLLIDPISSERRVERDRDCIIKFDRFYVNASLNSNDFSKFTLFNSCVVFFPVIVASFVGNFFAQDGLTVQESIHE